MCKIASKEEVLGSHVAAKKQTFMTQICQDIYVPVNGKGTLTYKTISKR